MRFLGRSFIVFIIIFVIFGFGFSYTNAQKTIPKPGGCLAKCVENINNIAARCELSGGVGSGAVPCALLNHLHGRINSSQTGYGDCFSQYTNSSYTSHISYCKAQIKSWCDSFADSHFKMVREACKDIGDGSSLVNPDVQKLLNDTKIGTGGLTFRSQPTKEELEEMQKMIEQASSRKCDANVPCDDGCPSVFSPSISNGQYKAWCITQMKGDFINCRCEAPIQSKIKLNTPIPGLGKDGGTGGVLSGGLASYIKHLYIFFIGASIIVALCVIIISGFKWLISGGNTTTIGKSKERIKGSVIGVLLALFSYSILYFISPALVRLEFSSVFVLPPLVEKQEMCSDYRLSPFNSPNILSIGKDKTNKKDEQNWKGWTCGEGNNVTVDQFNSAGVIDSKGGLLFVSGDYAESACRGFVCPTDKICSRYALKCLDFKQAIADCRGETFRSPSVENCRKYSFVVGDQELFCEHMAITDAEKNEQCVALTFPVDKNSNKFLTDTSYTRGCDDITGLEVYYVGGASTWQNIVKWVGTAIGLAGGPFGAIGAYNLISGLQNYETIDSVTNTPALDFIGALPKHKGVYERLEYLCNNITAVSGGCEMKKDGGKKTCQPR